MTLQIINSNKIVNENFKNIDDRSCCLNCHPVTNI